MIPGVSDREANLVQKLKVWRGTLGGWTTAAAQGLGGWTLEPHHVYDPVSKTLYLGSGDRISGREVVKPDRRVMSGGGTTIDAATSDLDGVAATSVRHGTPSGIVVTAQGDVCVTVILPGTQVADFPVCAPCSRSIERLNTLVTRLQAPTS